MFTFVVHIKNGNNYNMTCWPFRKMKTKFSFYLNNNYYNYKCGFTEVNDTMTYSGRRNDDEAEKESELTIRSYIRNSMCNVRN